MGQRGGGVFEGEKGVGEMVKGLTYAVRVRKGDEDVVAAVVVDGRGEVESPRPMFCPRRPS